MTQILSVQQKAAPAEGFDDFVKSSDKLSAFNGVPGVGQFRSEITNRASILDISKDLAALFGVDRIQTPKMVEMLGEYGPSGQRVYSHINDKQGRFRFVGLFQNANDNNGQAIAWSASSTNSFIEIVFFGTGLNWLVGLYGGYGFTGTYSVDGGSEVALGNPASVSSVINVRSYNPNNLLPIVSGLPLALHTVKIKRTDVTANPFYIHGFEILNESSTLSVKPGIGYSRGREVILSILQNIAHNSSFESGSLGTRGGRVVAYLKPNGTIGKAVTPVDPVQGNILGASHANEEVLRQYFFREFGVGRADDFSTLTGTPNSRAFTLEDGTTSIIGENCAVDIWGGSIETLSVTNGTSNFITITFIGTGLDVIMIGDSSTRGFTVSIDGGASIGQIDVDTVTNNNSGRTFRVVSGLPYGTHTVRFSNANGGLAAPGIRTFIVYGPKKSTIPNNAIEISEYFVLANFVHLSTPNVSGAISQGVIRKSPHREFVYSGSGWVVGSFQGPDDLGFQLSVPSTSGAYVEHTFFGTGFDARFEGASNRSNLNITLNGLALTTANFPTAVKSIDTSLGADFDLATGVYDIVTSSGSRQGLGISGLPLAKYTVRFTAVSANIVSFLSLGIITPIHSAKSSLAGFQNAFPIGNCSLLDTRKTSPVKNENKNKIHVQAVGIVANPTTTSSSFVIVTDLSTTFELKESGKVEINYSIENANSNVLNVNQFKVFLNSIGVGVETVARCVNASFDDKTCTGTVIVELPAGTHKVDLRMLSNGGGTLTVGQRILTVKEL